MGEAVGLITARGGSKSIPGKNLKPLAGKPLVAWTIEAARATAGLSRVLLSTDDVEIARVGGSWGAEVPFLRPAELAGDSTPHLDVVLHALDWLESNGGLPEYLLLLQPTSPLRTAQDLDEALRLARNLGAAADAVVSVTLVERHPYLMKRLGPTGALEDFMKSELAYKRRQDLPPVFAPNGAVFLNRVESLRRDRTFYPARAFPYVMPRERSIDLDEPWDFELAELVLAHRPRPPRPPALDETATP